MLTSSNLECTLQRIFIIFQEDQLLVLLLILAILISFATSVSGMKVNFPRFSWTEASAIVTITANTLGGFFNFTVSFRVECYISSDNGSSFCESGNFGLVTLLKKKIIQDGCSLSQQFSYKFIIKVVAPCRSNSVINSPLSIKVIFSKEIVLSERNGFTVFKNDLFSTTLLAFSDGKYSFFLAFYRYDTYLFLYFWNKRLLSSCLCFREQFLKLLRIILALENSALMNVSD